MDFSIHSHIILHIYLSVGHDPVSYTHLDVYKRQVKYTPSSCYIGETPWSFGTLVINNKTEVSITRDMVSGFDNTSAHTCQITVTYKGRQTSYLLPVVTPKTSDITSLQISAKPSRLSYTEGDLFNPSGVSFFATIGGRYAYIYSGYTLSLIHI